MNVLNTIYAGALKATSLLAEAKPGDAPGYQLFGDEGIIGTWQILGIVGLIGLVVFWVIYRKKQSSDD